ncbi:MAG: hypothetical protein ACI86C_001254 [Candidatus Latescibacterota bacterium]|jgi:hypothetical protein
MQLQERINAFVTLGQFMGQFASQSNIVKVDGLSFNDTFFDGMLAQIQLAKHKNGWFIEEHVHFTCKSWSEALSEENVTRWLSAYTIPEKSTPKTVGLIMAGNIPLVGFHDFLTVLLSGHSVIAKLSSNDKALLPFLAEYLIAIAPELKEYISFSEEKLEGFDAVIATGSNNSARYFEYYFGKYPHIIRKNRNSVAVLSGNETPAQMIALSDDVYRYFGLGCRNVSKIYIPKDYNFDAFYNGMYTWKEVINNHKYINNYDYNKAVYLMSDIKLLDNEFLLLKEDAGFSSPISVVFYETYDNLSEIQTKLSEEKDTIQCVVSNMGITGEIPFGETQTPQLWDYADGVDTMDFLLKLN